MTNKLYLNKNYMENIFESYFSMNNKLIDDFGKEVASIEYENLNNPFPKIKISDKIFSSKVTGSIDLVFEIKNNSDLIVAKKNIFKNEFDLIYCDEKGILKELSKFECLYELKFGESSLLFKKKSILFFKRNLIIKGGKQNPNYSIIAFCLWLIQYTRYCK